MTLTSAEAGASESLEKTVAVSVTEEPIVPEVNFVGIVTAGSAPVTPLVGV